jgi:hypothetical protein
MPTYQQWSCYSKLHPKPTGACELCFKVPDKNTGSTMINDSFKVLVCNKCIDYEIRKIFEKKMKNIPKDMDSYDFERLLKYKKKDKLFKIMF